MEAIAQDIPVSERRLSDLRALANVPEYDRVQLTPGILHIGVGNFHRAHFAVYMDDLFRRGLAKDWAIVGASVRPEDHRQRDALQRQDFMTTVIELHTSKPRARITGSMIDYIAIDPESLLSAMVNPSIRIVSLTITEGGYFLRADGTGLDRAHPDIRADLAQSDAPRTTFGVILKALKLRRAAKLAPFTILSCDNLPGNGDLTRQVVLELAENAEPGLAEWISRSVSFPNSMVDRITPASGPNECETIRKEFGIADAVPVFCEPFRQWVVEDKFCNGRPPLEQVGVAFVSDVRPYELMKLRLLNAGHACLAYAGALLGYRYVHEAITDPDIRNWVLTLMQSEIIPTLKPLKTVNYDAYLHSVLERFANPLIKDTIERNAAFGSDRQPKFIFPVLRDALRTERSIDGLALEIALWCRYCLGTDEGGAQLAVVDQISDSLNAHARLALGQPSHFLDQEKIFGDLGAHKQLRTAFACQLQLIAGSGVRQALQAYVAEAAVRP